MISEGDGKPIKKPVPLPRKSLLKQNKNSLKETLLSKDEKNNGLFKEKEEKNFVRDDWKSASESFVFEKKRLMKSEVNKFEKSVRNIISRRKSGHTKSLNLAPKSELTRSDSLPDNSIFCNISFNSPLAEGSIIHSDKVDGCVDKNYYENKVTHPPNYPPPDPPDESIYDQMKIVDFPNLHSDFSYISNNSSSSISTGSDCMTPCDFDSNREISKYDLSLVPGPKNVNNRYEIVGNSAIKNCSDEENSSLNQSPTPSETEKCCSEVADCIKNNAKPFNSQIKYIIHLFDPLQDNKLNVSDNTLDLLYSESTLKSKTSDSCFIDSKESEPANHTKDAEHIKMKTQKIIPPNLKEGHYGKIKKPSSSSVELPSVQPNIEPPPIPPRNFPPRSLSESLENKKESSREVKSKSTVIKNEKEISNALEEKHKSSDVMQWSSLKRVAKKVADNIEHRTSYLSLSGKKINKNPDEEFSTKSLSKVKSFCGIGNLCQLPQNFSKHSGIMYRPGGIERWGVLSQRKLTLFANKDSPDVKETVPMDNVLSIQATLNKIRYVIGEYSTVALFFIFIFFKFCNSYSNRP